MKPSTFRVKSPGKYVVDGDRFYTIEEMFKYATRVKGFNGSENTFRLRWRRDLRTWDELAAPVPVGLQKERSKNATANWKRKHDEMAEIIRALDARKSEAKA